MKKYLLLPLLGAALLAGNPATASAQSVTTKIGTVDMKKVFESYYKTKEAEAKINQQRNDAKKEMEERMDDAKKILAEVQKLDEEIAKPELSKEAKDTKQKTRSERASELQLKDREIRDFQTNREKQLQEQSVRMRAGIVEEINKVVGDKVKAENYDIVFDRSGPSLNGVPILLFAKDSYDFTPDVVTALNKNRSKESAESPAPAATPKADPLGLSKPADTGAKPKRP
jgi:outer membrane protein